MGAHPKIVDNPRINRAIFDDIDDALADLFIDASEAGNSFIDDRDANRAIRDIARKYGVDGRTIEHYFWEEYHNYEQ